MKADRVGAHSPSAQSVLCAGRLHSSGAQGVGWNQKQNRAASLLKNKQLGSNLGEFLFC